MEFNHTLGLLAVALFLGLLIGVERGWKYRSLKDGSRIAGLRTYGLIALLGAVAVMLSEQAGAYLIGVIFSGLCVALTASYFVNHNQKNISLTSLISALLAFSYGALVMQGYVTEASAMAVITTVLLSLKGELHRWLWLLEKKELWAALELLIISVVVLPILPDQAMGPWNALNPYEIWWMVVLIAAISFMGYFAMKIAGARKGIMLTALFAGLVSSTALTLQFSRMGRESREACPLLAAGILFACGTMFPRILLVAGVINPNLIHLLVWPVLVASLTIYLPAFWFWYQGNQSVAEDIAPPSSPLSLTSALGFGVLLAAILLLSSALQDILGEAGILILAAVSGVADVDPINLSLSGMSRDGLAESTAVLGIIIAAAVNSVLKGGMAGAIGGREVAVRATFPLVLSAVLALLTIVFI
ncbi:MgtC/SapB family protein [Oceanospirillum sp. D5]|uniref:MgtC/SapB family protein n=1 Tax=Oceanospirillum sediminis TaxID=2760088 RepID=A0A839IL32_9GAMM|nr:MgtC/SapB family protein [Oceanospirillum sediminis]